MRLLPGRPTLTAWTSLAQMLTWGQVFNLPNRENAVTAIIQHGTAIQLGFGKLKTCRHTLGAPTCLTKISNLASYKLAATPNALLGTFPQIDRKHSSFRK